MKRCPSCKRDRPKDEFCRHASRRDGLSAYCAECMQSKERKRRESAEYVALNKKRSAAWSQAHRELQSARAKERLRLHRDEILAKRRADYRIRKGIILAQQRVYNQRHQDKVKARNAKWRAAHPEKVKEIHRLNENRRRARIAGALSTLTKLQWEAILAFYDNRCAYCGRDGKLEQEHVIPVSRGGGTTAENIVPACGSCNRSKHAKTPEEWKALN